MSIKMESFPMKFSKFMTAAVIVAASLTALSVEAGSIGRSGGGFSGSRASSSSFSRPSAAPSAPSKPAVAPAPSQPGGIGGTTASVGVRKSEVTAPVQNQIAQSKPAAPAVGSAHSTSTSSGSYAPHYTPTPSYGYSTPPAPSVSNGSTFMSSLGGSMLGTMLGNSLSRPAGGTTIVNNGTPSTVSGGGVISSANAQSVDQPQAIVSTVAPIKKEYTVWSFIADLFGFVIVVAILLGIAWLFYEGFKMVRNYANKERGVSDLPFSVTQRFWQIQKGFAAADEAILKELLGPDVVDELTNDLQPSTLTLKNVSHEVRLQNTRELSVWYKFEDNGEDINQVWHYERFGSQWKLNGIENV